MEQNIWIQDGNTFVKGSATTKAHPEGLPKGIYEVKDSMTGYYLNRLGDSFVFNYKLYGINTNGMEAGKNQPPILIFKSSHLP